MAERIMGFKGHKHTPEACAKISAARKGQLKSAKTRAKMSVAQKGHLVSPEARKKMAMAKCGNKSNHWKGGRILCNNAYVSLFRPNHPFADGKGYVREHRLFMEAHIGRVLLPTELVHHINGDTGDNRIENLMLFSSNNEHAKYHWTKRKKGEI
jgi:hypothetical protein